ncbi:MAG: hypothetical protein HYU39_03305 [Thaumarchaeota archaeon]|nr:hypothetical protein [Nitrososphaerota archaeon]
MKDVRKIDDLKLVTPIQTVIDLFCFGEGGRDGAMRLLNQIKARSRETRRIDVTTLPHR